MPSAPTSTASWRVTGDTIEIRVADRSVVALTPSGRSVRIGLVVPVLGRVVDVSVQPASACAALAEAADRAGIAATAVEVAARQAVVEGARRAGAWAPSSEMCLLRAFGGLAFPLLGAAYDAGAAPLPDVPRWAAPILAAPTISDGATVAFGSSATRPVRRALVEAIRPLPTGEVDLAALVLAVMGRSVLQPDRLARVLRCDRVRHLPAELPDLADVEAARSVLRQWDDVRTERVLLDAAALSGGVKLLLDTVSYARQLGDHGPPGPLPNRLGELHDAHRSLMRSSSSTTPPPGERRPGRARAAARSCRAEQVPPHHALAPRTALAAVGAATAITSPPAARALGGRLVGDLTLVVPHTVGDLTRWGRLLSNCLSDFGPSAAAGLSTIIGVRRDNRLIYAIELSAGGAIRQFCGRANRPPTENDRRTVIRALAIGGVLDTRAPRNRPWLTGIDLRPGAT